MSAARGRIRGEDFVLRLELGKETLYEGLVSELPFPLQIGRQDTCRWKVPQEERSVSGLHAEVALKRKSLVVRDLGSRNGLYVMGVRVTEQRLAPGVQVSLGECRLIAEKNRFARASRILPFHRLERVSGVQSGSFYNLTETVTVIGHDDKIEGGIPCAGDILVSKRHAEIQRKPDDTCWIRDLGSKNGTLVNGVPLKDTERLLRDGDRIAVADVEFRFWDRTVEHARGHLLVKICIALATAAICGSLYFAWQTIWPSAKSMLRRAQTFEIAGRFDDADRILEGAGSARGGEYYKAEIERKRAELKIWRHTLSVWSAAKEAILKRDWVRASKALGAILNGTTEHWGWNSTTAPREKLRARTIKDVLDVFLDAQAALGGTLRTGEEGHERAAFADRLGRMEEMLKNPAWTSDLPTGKLREDLEDQCGAFRRLIADLDDVERVASSIRAPSGGRPTLAEISRPLDALDAEIAKLRDISSKSARREAERRVAAGKAGRKFVTSPIVSQRCDRYLPVLERFMEARAAFRENLRHVVEGHYASLSRELPFPSEQQCATHPHFGDMKRALIAVNDELCGPLKNRVRDQLSRLGSESASKSLSKCLLPLFDKTTMGAVTGCDSLSGKRPRTSRPAFSGKYDEIVGLETFAGYLRDIETERAYPDGDGLACPVPKLCRICALLRQVSRFKTFLSHPDVDFLVGLDSPGTNLLAEASAVVLEIDGKRELVVDSLWNAPEKPLRGRIISRGIALALDTEIHFGDDAVAALKADMKALTAEILALKRKIDSDPDNVTACRPAILAMGIPGLNGVNALWDQESKAKETSK